mgnify:CR=1 FL=1
MTDDGRSNGVIQTAVEGAIAGFAATVPMSAAMVALYQLLPRREQYPLPPHEITEELAARADQQERVDGEIEVMAATGVLHFGYGAAAGAAYALTADRAPLPPALKGALFGLAVWAGSYLGWLPAFDILPPATEDPPRRNLLMIAAHLIYGPALALGVDVLRRRRG